MLGALAFLGAAPDAWKQRGLDWAQTGIVVGGDFLLGQAARLIARSGPDVSWSFSEWLIELSVLRAQRLAEHPAVSADATSAALYEFPVRLGVELGVRNSAALVQHREPRLLLFGRKHRACVGGGSACPVAVR